jgi:hypothetical protein
VNTGTFPLPTLVVLTGSQGLSNHPVFHDIFQKNTGILICFVVSIRVATYLFHLFLLDLITLAILGEEDKL